MVRVAINGLGRIGRCLIWAIHERGLQDRIEVVAVNDLVKPEMLAHLLRHDTTHGHFHTPVSVTQDRLRIGGQQIRCFGKTNPSDLPWDELEIDIVLECTGKLKHRELLEKHLEAGAGRVLVAYPVAQADKTVVFGINNQTLTNDDRIVSNASCTTNCLAPVVSVLNDSFGIEQAQMTTIHAYTNDQSLIDKAHSDPYRARAAASNMIPTKTGAAGAVELVLPELAGRLDGMAVRVPTINVSMVDLHAVLSREVTVEEINQAMRDASNGRLAGILDYNEEPMVSVDFNHNPASSIFDATQTRVLGSQIKALAWYDNEWGFTNRMLDVTLNMP